MTPHETHPRTAPARLRAELADNRRLHDLEAADPTLVDRLRALQAWQHERLLETHRDLAADPRYAEGVRFFAEDLYAPTDFSARDADVERALPYMVRALPRPVLATAADGVRLNVLSRRLDHAMVEAIFERQAATAVDARNYAEAYRICDAFEDRKVQIDLVRILGARLDRWVRSPLVVGLLRMARRPARMAGLSALQDFLERGTAAFHGMGGSRQFVDTVTEREREILERIFARHPEPFAVAA